MTTTNFIIQFPNQFFQLEEIGGFTSFDEAFEFAQIHSYSNRPNFNILEEISLNLPSIPIEVLELNLAFKNSGFELFGVGGCVRDSILGSLPKDWDVCTNAIPSEVSNIIKSMSGWSILPIGEAFNIMAAISPLGEQYEIATFRTDSTSSDGRRPDLVAVSNIVEDSKRRDLTINSLYLNLDSGLILDPSNSGGISDLKKGIIKTVGNPIERFNEDKLRKLRVVRFALRFAFKIETETFLAIRNNPSLKGVSKERIAQEFRNIKCNSVSKVFHSMNALGLIEEIFGKQSKFLIESEIKNTKNLWPKIVSLWCIMNNEHPKNIFSKLNLTVDEKRLIEFIVLTSTMSFEKLIVLNSIAFKKQFELLKTNINFSMEELQEFFNFCELELTNLLNADFIKSNDNRLIGLEGKELGLKMESLQKECF